MPLTLFFRFVFIFIAFSEFKKRIQKYIYLVFMMLHYLLFSFQTDTAEEVFP